MSVNEGRIPKVEVYGNQNVQPPIQILHQVQQQPAIGQLPSAKDEDKMPLFLIKLWNIVEDPNYQQIIRWDPSGYSFHIVDPYSFCRNVLPHYFKHNNLNSLIRQLNMYGFRKMSPLDKGGLTRSESDQDHLEFSHACFIRDRPDLLVNIKRKQSTRSNDSSTVSVQTQNNLQLVMEELRQLREKQRNMDNKMHELTKENESLWEQMDHVRNQHNRQQQVVTKLVQFLVAMVQPNLSKRVLKRGVLAIDEPVNKRPRTNQPGTSSNLTEILDRLQRELVDNGGFQQQANYGQGSKGPIIADVTDEWGHYVPSPENSSNVGNMFTRSPTGTMNSPPMSATSQTGQQRRPPPQPTGPKDETQGTTALSIPTTSISMQPCSSSQVPAQSYSPSLTMTPALERQISAELQSGLPGLQEYLNGVDVNIDNCRDLLSGQWDFDFLENLGNEESVDGRTGGHQYQLALEDGNHGSNDNVEYNDSVGIGNQDHYVAGVGADVLEPPLNYPSTPELLTPCTSPQH